MLTAPNRLWKFDSKFKRRKKENKFMEYLATIEFNFVHDSGGESSDRLIICYGNTPTCST